MVLKPRESYDLRGFCFLDDQPKFCAANYQFNILEMISYISKQKIRAGDAIFASDIREGIFNLILQEYPGFTNHHAISIDELNHYGRHYLTSLINQEKGELAVIDHDVWKQSRIIRFCMKIFKMKLKRSCQSDKNWPTKLMSSAEAGHS